MKNGRVGSVLSSEAMLIRMQQAMGMPYALDSCCYHSGPHFANHLEKGDWADLGKVVYTWLLRKECHQAILPPLRNVVMFPHYLREVEDEGRRFRTSMFNLSHREARGAWTLASGKVLPAVLKFLKREWGPHRVMKLLLH